MDEKDNIADEGNRYRPPKKNFDPGPTGLVYKPKNKSGGDQRPEGSRLSLG